MFNSSADSWRASPRGPAARAMLGRGAVLLAALLAAKVCLLASLSEELFETHWFFVQPAYTPLATVGFYLLLAQCAVSLGLLARRSERFSTTAIRRLNVGLVATAVVFVFLSLKKGETSYLFALFQGWLKWSELGRYLAHDVFHAPPFLAVYAGGYGLGYWLLAKMGRESWSFYLLAGLGVVYAVFNLQDLRVFESELVVVNLFGLVSLGSAWRHPGRSLGAGWQMFFGGLVAVGWLTFAGRMAADENQTRYLMFFSAAFVAGYLAARVAARRSSSFPVLSRLLPFYAVGFFLLSNRSYPLSANFNHVFVYSLSAVRYAAPEVLQVAALSGLAWLIARRSPFGALIFFDAGAVVVLLLALADIGVTRRLGTRLDWNVVVMSDDPVLMWHSVQRYLWPVVGEAVLVLGGYWWMARVTRKRVAGYLEARFAASGGSMGYVMAVSAWLAIASPLFVQSDKAVAVPLVNLAASSPLARLLDFHRLTTDELVRESRELGIVDYLAEKPPPKPREPDLLNIVLIILESTYNKHLSLFGGADETQPLLAKYRDRMELFANYYAPFPNSLHARFSILNGLYPTVEYVSDINPRIPAPSLFEVLKDHGYVNSLFYSSHREYTRFRDYVGHRRLDVFYDCSDMPGREKFRKVAWGIEEGCTKQAIEVQFSQHAAKQERFFLTYIPAAPHMPFDEPDPRFIRFDISKSLLGNDYTGPYKNELLYMDWVVAGLLDKLSELGLMDRTLVVITGDHGEMLGDEGGQLGHGWSAEPVLCNVPLIILDPRRPGYRLNLTPGSHVDLLPTVLDALAIDLPPGELYQGVSLFDDKAARARRIYLGSYGEKAVINGDEFARYDPDSSRSVAQVYEISHEGPRSEFQPIGTTTRGVADLERFERLQRSLIRHYDDYRSSVAALRAKQAVQLP